MNDNNNQGRPAPARQGVSHRQQQQQQHAMHREAVLHQRYRRTAAQLLQLAAHRQEREAVIPAAQYYGAPAYPTTATMSDLDLFSILRSRSSNMGIPPTRATPYHHPSTANQLPPCALLSVLSSLIESIALPSTTPLQASAPLHHQASVLHPVHQRRGSNASMIPSGVSSPSSQVHSPITMMNTEPQPTSAAAWWEMKREHRQSTLRYRDFAKDYKHMPNTTTLSQHRRANNNQIFPVTLYEILSSPDLKDCISWLPHGRAFKIHNPDEMEEQVLPRYFRGTKISSFMRQVSISNYFWVKHGCSAIQAQTLFRC